MAQLQASPTRMELNRARARYTTARRGHKLLKDKRDDLMRTFLDVVRENRTVRERVEAALAEVYGGFDIAAAVSGPLMLKEALMIPKKEGELEVSYRNIMGVVAPQFTLDVRREGGADTYNYGLAFTSGELDAALRRLDGIFADLVRLAELEKTAQMLAEEIERTRRRVNALEYILIPRYERVIRTIRMKLEENERGNTTRLMKVKDLMLQKAREAEAARDAAT